MTKYVVDTWAWVEYLDGTRAGKKIAGVLEDKENRIYCSSASLAELVSRLARAGKNPSIATEAVKSLAALVPVDEALTVKAGTMHAAMRKKIPNFGMGDSFVIATADALGAKILTGDPHFKNVKQAVVL